VRLTLEYRRLHEDSTARDITIRPRMVVLHFTAGGSLESAWHTFDPARIDSSRNDLVGAGTVNVSAHYLVDRDGTIYRLMPDTVMARHCVGLNHAAIGIENVGDAKAFPLTDAQVEANAALLRILKRRFPITHLIGHSEYRLMEGHPYFHERDPRYRSRKQDPGASFMRRVRARVADLHLLRPPSPGAPSDRSAPR